MDHAENNVLSMEELQKELQIATEKMGILYWIYRVKEHQTVITGGKGYGYADVIENVPECFRGTGDIYPEDEAIYFGLFEQMEQGVDSCEGYARIYNQLLKTYQWQHIIFTKLDEHSYVGSSMDVTEQKRTEQKYKTELALRHELMKESFISYQINLTQNTVEDKVSKYPQMAGKKAPFPMEEEDFQWGVNLIPDEESRRNFAKLFSNEALLAAWEAGNTTVSIPAFQLKLQGKTRWYTAQVMLTKRPETGDIIAITYTNDIHEQMCNQLAMSRTFSEEMDFIALIDPESTKINLVAAYGGEKRVPPLQPVAFLKYRDEIIAPTVLEQDRTVFQVQYTVNQICQTLETDSVYLFSYRIKEADGQVRRKQLRAFYLDDSKEIIVLSRRDITDLYNEEIKQAQTLQHALEEARTASAAKTAFLSQMSHDMRTPMNGILGLTTLMKDKTDLTELQEDIDQISLSGHYLLNLINDTLDINKIEAGKLELHLKPMNSEELFTNILRTVNLMAREHDIAIQLKIPEIGHGRWIPVLGDASRVEQVFMNIVSNAVKYTPRGGTVEIRMETLSITEEYVVDQYTIKDTGIGMSEEFIPHIFDTFSQEGRVNTERQNGTGLGMAIVKQLVELMNGTITIQSQLNVGTEVTITLKYPVFHGDMGELSEDAEDGRVDLDILCGKKILLCEDHPLNQKIATQLLQKKQMQVVCAENGKIGVDTFAASKPGEYAAILMDVRMPVMDGIEATRRIRGLKREDAGQIPILAMTANAFEEDVQTCKAAGMNAHLAKPFDVEALYRTLAQKIEEMGR